MEVGVGTALSLEMATEKDAMWTFFVSRMHGTLADVRSALQAELEVQSRGFTFRRIKHTATKLVPLKVGISGESQVAVTALEHDKEIYVQVVFAGEGQP